MALGVQGFEDAAMQATMLLDRARMDAYARAIAGVVTAGDVVVDVGAGTGVLSVLAARAGARRVWAVERGPAARVAEQVVRASGVDEIVRVVRADIRDFPFPEPPTVVLSETLGSLGIDEDIAGLFLAVAPRCAPGARFLPGALEPMLALVQSHSLGPDLRELGSIAGVDLSALRAPLLHRPLLVRLRPDELASIPLAGASIRLGSEACPRALKATLRACRDASIDALGAWFQASLAPGVSLATSPSDPPTHWAHILFPLDPPLDAREGDEIEVSVSPRMVKNRALWAWSARLGPHERRGDALQSALGGLDDLLPGLALRGVGKTDGVAAQRLRAWRAALGGEGFDAGEMAVRLREAMPDRYDRVAAEQEVTALLAAAQLADP